MNELRVLLVEDDEAQARLIVERLRSTHEIRIARTCETLADAISAAREDSRYDGVLLDLGLPDSEGIDSVLAVHNAAPRLPIVVLSGQADVGVAIEAMRHGAQDYVVKSAADAANLARAVRLAVERKRLQDTEQMLIGVVSHDLRGPLQTIVLGSEMMLRESPPSRHAASVHRAALRATALVHDLLDATRARLAGVLPIELADVDLRSVIEQVIDDARVLHPTRMIDAHLASDAPTRGDARRLAQVAQNLVGNAIQHSPPGSPVRVSLRRDGGQYEIAVHNLGQTIPPALREHIFEPLERASKDRTHSIGLGLYIAAEIVRAHAGTIAVDSDTQVGTTFMVRIPATASAAP